MKKKEADGNKQKSNCTKESQVLKYLRKREKMATKSTFSQLTL